MSANMNQPEPKTDGSASWIKLDTSVLDNDKLIESEDISPAACWLWIKSILFAFRNDTDGRITPAQARRVLLAEKSDVEVLIRCGLWERTNTGEYLVHDYLEHQLSHDQRENRRAKRTAAAHARWGRQDAPCSDGALQGAMQSGQQGAMQGASSDEDSNTNDSNENTETPMQGASKNNAPCNAPSMQSAMQRRVEKSRYKKDNPIGLSKENNNAASNGTSSAHELDASGKSTSDIATIPADTQSDVELVEAELVPEEKDSGEREAPRRSRRSKPLREIPDDWKPTDRHRKTALERGLDCAIEAERFVNYCKAHGRKYRDFNAAFSNWLTSGYTNRTTGGRQPALSKSQLNDLANQQLQKRMSELDRMLGLTSSSGERSNR